MNVLVYRAVSLVEWKQIDRTRRFETVPEGCEGKHFWDSLDGAVKFGTKLLGAGNFCVIEAEVSEEASSLYRWLDLDGCGPARFLGIDDLRDVEPRLLIPEVDHG